MNTCLRLPRSLEDASAIVSACSGVPDWRPAFLMGLGAAGVAVLLLVMLLLVVRSVR